VKIKKATLNGNQLALLKALWFDAAAPFSVSTNEVPPLLTKADRKQYDELKAQLDRHQRAAPPKPVTVHGVKGGGQAMRVLIRGRVDRPGEPAPPGFLRVLQRADAPQTTSPSFTRLDLANAIASAENPLTARVFVNRVWQHHFGRGIVSTASNFGKLGDQPTHPELLDTLAVRFIESGWSVKWLHREIMLSATYQLRSDSDPANAAKDADNQFLWRMSPRRLDVEAWRDALLAVSNRLNRTLGGHSLDLNSATNVRRTLYAGISRYHLDSTLAVFDFPDANVTSDQRSVTTAPQQQLFVLNSAFMIKTSQAFASRLQKSAQGDEARIVLAFQLAFNRAPTEAEKKLSLEFLHAASADKLTRWEQYAQALLATNEFNWVD
jgi:Protein of unknown function (DUF1553)